MKYGIMVSLIVSVLLTAGCATTVSDYTVTPRDEEKYTSKSVDSPDYDRSAYVLETRGEGAIACISIGTKDNVKKGSKIEFYRIVKRNKEKFEIVFATGTVFQASANTSWVKVNDPVRAGVRLNHFARLSPDQKKSPADKVKGFLGVY